MTQIKQLDSPHYCNYCGKELVRKRFNSGRLEDFGVFKKRKYCDMECYRKGELLSFASTQKNQEFRCAHTTARKVARTFMDTTRCELCGSTKNLDIHHKDKNYNNNNLDNLQVLCRSCHMKQHKQKDKCKICGEEQKGHGYCNKHLKRKKKYNCPFFSKFYTPDICRKCARNDECVEMCLKMFFEGEYDERFNEIYKQSENT